ncbi:MAG TPA: glycosyl hydrolase family 28-related protein, partial [Opitutaceae bacterium]
MPPLRYLAFFLCALLSAACVGAPAASASGSHRSITAFGAVGDGRTLNTEAIQKTIDATAAAGGGVVEIPAGTFRSGSIFLKQGVELFLAEGAVLLGSNRLEDYPKRETRIEGHFEPWRMALVNAERLEHVRLRGRGKLDGNGILFWAAFWQR